MIWQILRWYILIRVKFCEERKNCLQPRCFTHFHELLPTKVSRPLGYVTHYLSASNSSPLPPGGNCSITTFNYSARGPHCPSPHPNQKVPTATAVQHSGPTAPLTANKTPLLSPASILPVFLNVCSISSKIQWVMMKLKIRSPSLLMYYGLS